MTAHHEYDGSFLKKTQMPASPFAIVDEWVQHARKLVGADGSMSEPDAMTVATCGVSNQPQARTVLLRHWSPSGPGFLTNLQSKKSLDIMDNPRVAANLVWPNLFRAIRFSGVAVELPRSAVTEYFGSRPYGSRLAAWASAQSQPLGSRAELLAAVENYAQQWPDTGRADDVPVPEFWGGYVIHCVEVEVWSGQRSRMHDRICYTATNSEGVSLMEDDHWAAVTEAGSAARMVAALPTLDDDARWVKQRLAP